MSNDSNNTQYILEVHNLKKYFPIETNFFGKPTRYLHAVDDVSFNLKSGTTIGVVGESGCGKTTLGRISGIMDDIALAEGQSIVVPVPVDIGGDDGGIAGATMSWDSWSLTDWRGESHIAAASDDFAEYAPDKVMGTFTLR